MLLGLALLCFVCCCALCVVVCGCCCVGLCCVGECCCALCGVVWCGVSVGCSVCRFDLLRLLCFVAFCLFCAVVWCGGVVGLSFDLVCCVLCWCVPFAYCVLFVVVYWCVVVC